MTPPLTSRRRRVREHLERAHREVQDAQRLAYDIDAPRGELRLRERLALNRAQTVLIKLLIALS